MAWASMPVATSMWRKNCCTGVLRCAPTTSAGTANPNPMEVASILPNLSAFAAISRAWSGGGWPLPEVVTVVSGRPADWPAHGPGPPEGGLREGRRRKPARARRGSSSLMVFPDGPVRRSRRSRTLSAWSGFGNAREKLGRSDGLPPEMRSAPRVGSHRRRLRGAPRRRNRRGQASGGADIATIDGQEAKSHLS